jgi:hypothetical protein
MRQSSKCIPDGAEKTVRDVRRAMRRHYSAEEKIRPRRDGKERQIPAPTSDQLLTFPAPRRHVFAPTNALTIVAPNNEPADLDFCIWHAAAVASLDKSIAIGW